MAGSDRRRMLLDSYENAAVIVSGIDAGELGHPTPCPGYDVAGLIDHLVEVGRRAAALGRGQAPPPGDESPHVELSDTSGQLRNAAQEAARAWGDTSSLSLRHAMPWGEQYTGPPWWTCTRQSWPHTPGTWPGPPDSSTSWPLPPPCPHSRGTGHDQAPVPQHGRPGTPFGRQSSQLLVLTTGNASRPSRDATHGQRPADKEPIS
jgi:hypothetical protein